MKLQRRYPNYFTGFEETVHEVNTLEELMEIDWVKRFIESENFTKLSISKGVPSIVWPALMAEYNEGDKHTWWVIGYFTNGYSDIGLDEFIPTPREPPKLEPIRYVSPKKPEYNTLDSFIKHVSKE